MVVAADRFALLLPLLFDFPHMHSDVAYMALMMAGFVVCLNTPFLLVAWGLWKRQLWASWLGAIACTCLVAHQLLGVLSAVSKGWMPALSALPLILSLPLLHGTTAWLLCRLILRDRQVDPASLSGT